MSDTGTVDAPVTTTDAPAPSAPTEGAKQDAGKAVDMTAKEGDGNSLLGKKPVETKVEKVIPEKYEFKLPEGMQLDAELLEQATPLLKKFNLDQSEANELAGLIVKREQANVDRWNKQVDGWKQATLKELGDNAETELAGVSKFIDRFGGKRADAIRSIMNDTGLGSNPDVVHLFREAAKFYNEDSFAVGSNKNKPSDPEARARKMFPNTKY